MPDTPVAPQGGPPYDPVMEARVSRLEEDMRDIRPMLTEMLAGQARIEAILAATLPHLATKADVAGLRAEMEQRFSHVERRFSEVEQRFSGVEGRIAGLEVKLADKPGKTYMWGVLGVLLTAYACGLAALAVLR